MTEQHGFTIYLKNGQAYDATSITKTIADFTGRPCITILCSGITRTWETTEIDRIEWVRTPAPAQD